MAADVVPQERIAEILKSNFPQVEIEKVQKAPWSGWYEVLSNGGLVYVSEDATLLFSGQILNIPTKQDMTRKRWDMLHPAEFDKLPFEQALKYVNGNGKRQVVVFADPDCPFCQELEKQLIDFPDVTVFTFLFPLEDLHPGATDRARRIWCAENRDAAWTEWMREQREPLPTANCDPQHLYLLGQLGQKLKINSTPTLFFADGHRASYMPTKEQLEGELLEAEQNLAGAKAGASVSTANP